MILFIVSFSLNLLKTSQVPKDAMPTNNPIYFYTPGVQERNMDFNIEKIHIFKENQRIFSFTTRGENGFYFSDNLKYAIGIKKNTLNLYENGNFVKSFKISYFSGGHFSKDRFVAKGKNGVFVIDKNNKKFYKGLIDIYYLKNQVLKISPDKIWIERKNEKIFLPFLPYIRKISVSDNIIVYSTKNEICFYNISKNISKRIKIKGSITSLYAGKDFVFAGVLYDENCSIKIFDLKGDEIYKSNSGKGFISKIYEQKGKIYVLKDRELMEFELR